MVLLSGLVHRGSKDAADGWVLAFQTSFSEPKNRIIVGAIAGVGFGVFEAQWVLNSIFAQGWSPALIQAGFMGIAGFWERFFTIAFHTASAGLAGWGLARGYGWQFYLITSFIHFLSNYTIILLQKGILSSFSIEIIIAVIAVLLFAAVSWLRWRKEINEQPPLIEKYDACNPS